MPRPTNVKYTWFDEGDTLTNYFAKPQKTALYSKP